MPSISVIIPTYNSTQFIRETLRSVFEQTRRCDEIIVVDDASTDGTPELVASIARSAPIEVHLIRCPKNHGGPPAPLNIGVAHARGELIATLDHDDEMLPAKLEMQTRLYEKCPDLGLIISYLDLVGSGTGHSRAIAWAHEVLKSLSREEAGDGCFRVAAADAYNALVNNLCYPLTCSNFMLPKSVWRECGGFDRQLPAMADLGFLQAVTRRYDLGIVAAELVRWNGLPGSHYVNSPRKDLSTQTLRILKRFDRQLLTAQSRRMLRERLHKQFLCQASIARLEADYTRASLDYLISIYYGVGTLFHKGPAFLFRVFWHAIKKSQHRMRSMIKQRCESEKVS